MFNVVTNEVRIGAQLLRLILIFLGAEVDNRRKIFTSHEAPQNIDPIALAMAAAQQNEIAGGTGKLVRQVPCLGWVVGRDNRVRPKGRDVVHEQGTKLCLLVDNHDLDSHKQDSLLIYRRDEESCRTAVNEISKLSL